jgi:hypothetical protein
MLAVQPKFSSATPMMVFTGQSHQAALLSHIQSAGSAQYDSLLMVNRIGVENCCLIVALESEAAGQPLKLVIYTGKGRQVFPMNKAEPIGRQNFLAAAFFIVQNLLHDRLQMPVVPPGKPAVEEKPLQEFYPDPAQRLKLHYHFAHRWLPVYAKSDPVRFFGYFQRGEQEPAKFIQARWQIMERELKLISPPPPGQLATVIRRVSDLQMWVEFPSTAAPSGEGSPRFPIAVVQMPVPEFMTHAYFVGIVLVPGEPGGAEPAKPQARVFTLEKIEQHPSDGRLCEWIITAPETTHRNYGTQVPATREAFIKAVFAKIAEAPRGPFTSVSFVSPAAGTMPKDQSPAGNPESLTGIQCPKCAWVPLKSSQWTCSCGHLWNTFDTHGKCPNCNRQWAETACHSCEQMSPHEAWYTKARASGSTTAASRETTAR